MDSMVIGFLSALSDDFPKAIFPNGRFPEKPGPHYDNSAQNFREIVHSGKWLSGNRTVTGPDMTIYRFILYM
jgi:hypothetical protein